MDFNSNFQNQDAVDFINTSCDFTHKDGRISTPFGSKVFIVLLIVIYIAIGYALTYFKTIDKHLNLSEAGFYAIPIAIVIGVLLNLCIKTNKVIDYKNNLIYCELLIFNFSICRYSCIDGNEISAVGNNTLLYHTKRGVTYSYYTSFLLKDGTLNDFFDFGSHYSAAYNLAIVLAYYFHKPLTLTRKDQQLTPSAGSRLSTLTINPNKIQQEEIFKTVVWTVIIIVITFVLFFTLLSK